MEGPKGSSSPGPGFAVEKTGDARISLIGFPSVGKSTFVSAVTNTESEVAAYEFTTLTCIGGILELEGAKIQLLDTPGIIEGAAQGKGRGREVIAVSRTADVLLMMLDAANGEKQRIKLTREMRTMGIRLNERPPNINFTKKTSGGIQFNKTVPVLSHLDEKMVRAICQTYKIFHAQILIREDATVDQFIDVVMGNCVYIPTIYCYNKIDNVSLERVDKLARLPHSVVVSCNLGWGMDVVLSKCWQYLNLCRIYTKRRGELPSFGDPLILRKGATVKTVCRTIHRDFEDQLKYALVWGVSAKHSPQKVGVSHPISDEDVIQLVKK
ncbi:MAG: GTP-binding protein [archaeon]|nr:GTP-binding protein [archaeon]